MAIHSATQLNVIGDIALLTVDSPPVNAATLAVRQGIWQHLGDALADRAVNAIVLICAGKTFMAGADVRELGAPPQSPKISEIEALIDAASKPVIAALHGTALGGGLELALSCHYRIAVPSTQCGLTEVTLGLLPGAGGTQRLPRVVGVERALAMVTTGERVDAPTALAIGLVDELAPAGQLREAALAFARRIVDEARSLRRVRDRDEKLAEVRGRPEVFANFRAANAHKFRGFAAPEYNIRCIEAAVNEAFDEGLKTEKRLYAELAAGPQPAALQYAFFAQRQVDKIPGIPATTPTLPIARVGVVGAGTMGGGIAMNFANIGMPVTLMEVSSEALERGLATIRRNYENSVKRGRISAAQLDERLACINGTTNIDDLADVDLIIEAVFEDLAVKQDVFRRLDAVAKPTAIFASNTSFLDIDQIAAATGRPQQVLGLHFFSPANVMTLLEIVRGEKTSKEVVATAMALARTIGKTGVLVRVCDGFAGNRVINLRKTQGQALLLEGALPWQVDRAMEEFGFPMGPFAMSDLAGLDIGWSAASSRGETVRDVLCEMGRRGQKTAAGYYDYDANRKRTPSPLVQETLENFLAARAIRPRQIGDEEILQRCIFPMINEGIKLLEENIVIRAADIDVVMVSGYGFPKYRGGLMYYADSIGLDKVLGVMRQLEARLGPAMKPARLLEHMVAEGTVLHRFENVR